MFGVYRNPDLSDESFDCLLTVIAKVQSVKRRKTSFLFVGDVNARRQQTKKDAFGVFLFIVVLQLSKH